MASKHPSTWAHPRSRGENSRLPGPRQRRRGSSPLTRGKRAMTRHTLTISGLIPAHAGKTQPARRGAPRSRAHPRSRGENICSRSQHPRFGGSSPLTRGKPRTRRPDVAARRLIPAHAGKTTRSLPGFLRRWAHPRSRGENGSTSRCGSATAGSSPLTRGKLGDGCGGGDASGLIPAHAGKTSASVRRGRPPRAHPRSRGENQGQAVDCVGELGSSPLTRGKHGEDARCQGQGGLIPAHAGKTPGWYAPSDTRPAHPRSRGENPTVWETSLARHGSSPLTRGKPPGSGGGHIVPGLIPAHAGKTSSVRCPIWRRGAHPRSRGENSAFFGGEVGDVGSSPLTRGKRSSAKARRAIRRLIPAHAGKTAPLNLPWGPTGAHPRSRGENALMGMIYAPEDGSSPLTRGKLSARPCFCEGRRLIPAHAGKTQAFPMREPTHGAHPRSRGENQHQCGGPPRQRGSSPLTRGKLHLIDVLNTDQRLIPAHAGKTMRLSQQGLITRAHPRSRGENFKHGIEAPLDLGSSPLTRGKRRRRAGGRHPLRLIPAHAGKTGMVLLGETVIQAHPRSRGENGLSKPRQRADLGSSPLTRGKRCVNSGYSVPLRLIPAHAGKTRVQDVEHAVAGAHPRSRGENLVLGEAHLHLAGSSPLTRGKLCAPGTGFPALRLIPAHAGKTSSALAVSAASAAHPRSRGENEPRTSEPDSSLGSSPLTRGKLGDCYAGNVRAGLIPAHAGKTAGYAVRVAVQAAHPRSRGENESVSAEKRAKSGSSPLTRGKLCVWLQCLCE